MCERVTLPDGTTMIVCGTRRRARKCAYCPRPSEVLCDAPRGKGKTCDRPCCRAHAKRIGPDKDLCRECAVAASRSAPTLF